MRFFSALFSTTLLCAWQASAAAQAPHTIPLTSPEPLSDAVFTRVVSVRELRDSSLLVSDRGEQQLFHLRTDGSAPTPVGRVGSGPGEYRQLGWLFPLPSDSSALIDTYSGRILLLDGARIVRTHSENEPLALALGTSISGASARGHLLSASRAPVRSTSTEPQRLALLLARRSGTSADTIGSLLSHAAPVVIAQRSSGPANLFVGNPLTSLEQAALSLDGWIAVARLNPYRIDWRRPDGQWVRGAPIETTAVAVSEREKCFALRRWLGSGAPCDPSSVQGWPTHLPPFLKPASTGGPPIVFIDFSGNAVIARAPSADLPLARYDLVDRGGKRVGVISLSGSRSIVGFGRGHVFVAATDADGLQTIERYSWRF